MCDAAPAGLSAVAFSNTAFCLFTCARVRGTITNSNFFYNTVSRSSHKRRYYFPNLERVSAFHNLSLLVHIPGTILRYTLHYLYDFENTKAREHCFALSKLLTAIAMYYLCLVVYGYTAQSLQQYLSTYDEESARTLGTGCRRVE